MGTKYRLALDVGTNSLGWAVLPLTDNGAVSDVLKIGARIFSDSRDPKSKTSLAVERRQARQARRRRDRFLRRKNRLLKKFIDYGLFPSSEAERRALVSLDPYELRARGLTERLTPGELARALFHLNQRRGFQSNRINDSESDAEDGLIKGAISLTRQAMESGSYRTIGAYLYSLKSQGKPTRARRGGEANEYELYVDRSMIAEEFDALWAAQQAYHPELLTEQAGADLRDTLLHQRPLRPVDPGWCSFEAGKHRAALALPLCQHFRMYQELNNLRVVRPDYSERELTIPERDALFNELETLPKLTFAKIRRAIGCERDERINLEVAGRKHLNGNLTACLLSEDKCFGPAWYQLSRDAQNEIVKEIIEAREDAPLIEWLKGNHDLSADAAQSIAKLRLPDGYGSLSETAIGKVVSHLAEAVITFDKAAAMAGYDHSSYGVEDDYDLLPYYGKVLEQSVAGQNPDEDDEGQLQYGRIANPTVHVALNQIRKVVNTIIEKFGKPEEIVLEVTRELKMSSRQKTEIQKTQKENAERNEAFAADLARLGVSNNYQNRLRLRLWQNLNPNESLNRRCPYSGKQISISMLFSPEIEIDHIIPFSRSLDDSISNKVLCTRSANREKGDRTPFEAFGDREDWEQIVLRASKMPAPSARRFTEAAAAQTRDDFIARQLNDTAYISRVASEYMTSLVPAEKVWTVPGRLTAMLRHGRGLNAILGSNDETKDRDDHRHHAIDAVVIGCTDRRTLHQISRASAQERADKVSDYIQPPFEGLRIRVVELLERTLVSHRPEHGIEGQLHNATAYGLASEPDQKGVRSVVTRKMLADLKSTEIQKIRDSQIREQLIEATSGKTGAEFNRALIEYGAAHGIRRVRLLDRIKVREVVDKNGRAYKGFKPDGNHCIEIIIGNDGRWKDDVILAWDANSPAYRRFQKSKDFHHESFNGEKLVMRLYKGDCVAIGENGRRRLLRVCQFTKGSITLGPIEGSNLDARNRDNEDPFSFTRKSANALKAVGARKVFVTPIGALRDPGS